MASLGIWTIRLLRRLPISSAFDAHLSRCALAEVWYDNRLTIPQIFGWSPIEDVEGGIDLGDEAIEAAVLSSRFAENQGRGVVGDPINFQHGPKTLQ